MKLDEAIEILQEDVDSQDTGEPSKYADACKLGIEALKMLKRMKEFGLINETSLLPGET